MKINHSRDIIVSKEKRIKVPKAQADELSRENKQLSVVNNAKEVKAMSMIEDIEKVKKLENENKTLKLKANKEEREIKKVSAELAITE